METVVVVAILLVAVFLFITEWVRIDAVALGVVLALLLTGILEPTEAFAGFSNPTVLSITFLFVVGGAVWQTGLADDVGGRLLTVAGSNETRLLVVLMVAVAIMSGFMSNTGTVAVLLPAVVMLANRGGLSPGKLLIPLSFGSMLGGAATLIGTPPNLVVSGALRDAGYEPFGFFTFLPFGLIILVVGVLYMLVIGRNLLPGPKPAPDGVGGADGAVGRDANGGEVNPATELIDRYHLRKRLLRLAVPAESDMVGVQLGRARLYSEFGVVVLKVMRRPRENGILESAQVRAHDLGHNRQGTPRPRRIPMVFDLDLTVEADDVLIVHAADPAGITAAARRWGLEVESPKPKDGKALLGRDVGVAEIVIPPRSDVIGQTLTQSRFDQTYKLRVLALARPGTDAAPASTAADAGFETPASTLDPRSTSLRFGDILVVQAPWEGLEAMRSRKRDFVVVGEPEAGRGAPRRAAAGRALAVLIGMVLLMITGALPVATVTLLAALAMVGLGCLSAQEAYRAVDWRSVVLIAGMLPMATALENVGLVDSAAGWLVDTFGAADHRVLLAGLFIMTAAFTQVLSNTATTVILAPVALATAERLGIAPEPLLMGVAVAASMAFATPMASPTNTLVMTAGNYRFSDYLRVGVPMIGVMMALTVVVLPILFPFSP